MEKFNEYQDFAISNRFSLNKFIEINPYVDKQLILMMGIAYDGLGLGEAGEVQGKIKKLIRDNGGRINHDEAKEIIKELGDILFYIASMSEILGYSLADVAQINKEKILSRIERNTLGGSGDNR